MDDQTVSDEERDKVAKAAYEDLCDILGVDPKPVEEDEPAQRWYNS